jgi:hypothetical protein
MMAATFAGCNKQLVDTTFKYDRAVIMMPDGEIVDVGIKSWTDFEDGDQIQVKGDNGVTYLVHSANVVLVAGVE